MSYPLPRELVYWKDAILRFLKQNPGLAASNTRGYFRFLESRGALSTDAADKLCSLVAQETIPKPETYVRVRRELIEKGLVSVAQQQRNFLDEQEAATRAHYREDKERNPLWHNGDTA